MSSSNFFVFSNQPSRIVVGLMSGTSVDGIDAAVVKLTGRGEAVSVELLAFLNIPFKSDTRKRIFASFNPSAATVDVVGALNMELGEIYANAALEAIKAAGLTCKQVDAIASHGQTIYHEPLAKNGRPAFTVQIGDGNVIAQRTGIPCISDFRVADMAAGGQGAPLVPYTEFLLFRHETETVLLQNIGGIGNITVLAAGCKAEDVFAFDTGPGNMVIDAVVSHYTNGEMQMDIGGKLAAAGKVCQPLLAQMLNFEYFAIKPPKTTGRELFGVEFTNKFLEKANELSLSTEDTVATATALTAKSVALACENFILPKVKPTRLIIGGGGSYNKTLVNMLDSELKRFNITVQTQEQLGQNSDAKEAVAFAVLADCTLRGVPSALPAVTNAAYPAILGKISLPNGAV